tara:strand:- start:670 stop:831 length:162 start_codon:yes stop_codon:yes gene_type:complete
MPDAAMAAYEKGLACNINLIQELDFWGVADQQVIALRQLCEIPPTHGPVLLKP